MVSIVVERCVECNDILDDYQESVCDRCKEERVKLIEEMGVD